MGARNNPQCRDYFSFVNADERRNLRRSPRITQQDLREVCRQSFAGSLVCPRIARKYNAAVSAANSSLKGRTSVIKPLLLTVTRNVTGTMMTSARGLPVFCITVAAYLHISQARWNEMRGLTYTLLAAALGLGLTAITPTASAQIGVGVNIGVAPECPYGLLRCSALLLRSRRLLRTGMVQRRCLHRRRTVVSWS